METVSWLGENTRTVWLGDYDERRDPMQKLSDEFMKRQLEWIAETTARGVNRKLPTVSVDDLDGGWVTVQQDGRAKLRCQYRSSRADIIRHSSFSPSVQNSIRKRR